MEPFSLAASVIAVIQLSEMIISLCKWYITSLKDVPKDLRTIMIEAGSVKSVLSNLEFFMSIWAATGDTLHILKGLEGPEGPVEGCRKALVDLGKLFPSELTSNATDTKRGATTISYAKLAWPFKERKAWKILDDIVRYKATIALALTIDTAHDTKNITTKVERLCDTLNSQTREKALNWLVKTDPSPNHNAAYELHDIHTGTWVTRLPDYEDWKSGSTRFLWFHGIPGAGKTVLLSYIIEDVRKYCDTILSGDVTYAYYYCYFGRNQDETPHLLRWVINQLCRKIQYVPKEILDSFEANEQPSVTVLIQALSTVLRNFRRVYIILDALDESQERQNLLRLLNRLAGDSFEKIGLLATSRKEIDIEISLEPISMHMSLSNPHVDEDIRVYIQNQLQTHHRLCTWPPSLLAEISDALVKGAQGMFRWAACQIDILGRLHTASEIHEALNELPETLDETYERILMKIPVKKRMVAHKILQLLAFDDFGIYGDPDLLAEAVIVDVEQLTFKPEYRFLDQDALFEICTCLITLDGYHNVNIAHYSVKEYLVSNRIQHSTAAAFQISPAAYHVLLAKTALVYLLDITYDGLCSAKDYDGQDDADERDYKIHEKDNFPYLAEAHSWVNKVNAAKSGLIEVHDEAIIDGLVAGLLNSNRANYQGWLESTHIYRHIFISNGIYANGNIFPRWKTGSGLERSFALGYACYFNIMGLAKRILDLNPELALLEAQLEPDMDHYPQSGRDPPRTPLEVAIFYGNIFAVKLLIDWGADPNEVNPGGDTRLLYTLKNLTATQRSFHDKERATTNMLPLLLKAGADPNPRGVAYTPLQVATFYHSYSIVKMLLEAGSYVNAVGDDEAVVAAIKRDCSTRDWFYSQADCDERIRTRGLLPNYQTPVRIAETASLAMIRDLLMEYGGKSLSLFPIKHLPGYEEAEFCALSGSGVEEVEEILETK